MTIARGQELSYYWYIRRLTMSDQLRKSHEDTARRNGQSAAGGELHRYLHTRAY